MLTSPPAGCRASVARYGALSKGGKYFFQAHVAGLLSRPSAEYYGYHSAGSGLDFLLLRRAPITQLPSRFRLFFLRPRKSDAVRTKFINPPRRAVAPGTAFTPHCAGARASAHTKRGRFAFLVPEARTRPVHKTERSSGAAGPSQRGSKVVCGFMSARSTASVVACHARDSESTGQPCFTWRRFTDSAPRQCQLFLVSFFLPPSLFRRELQPGMRNVCRMRGRRPSRISSRFIHRKTEQNWTLKSGSSLARRMHMCIHTYIYIYIYIYIYFPRAMGVSRVTANGNFSHAREESSGAPL